MRYVCVLFVSNTSDIVFNPSTDVTIDNNQSANDIDSYVKYQLYVMDPGNRLSVLVLLD